MCIRDSAVGLQLLGRDLQRVLPVGHQATLDTVLGVGQLDTRVADRAAAEAVQQRGLGAGLVVDDDLVPPQQAVVAVLVGDDLDLGRDLGVALDEPTDRGRQTRRETARGQQGDTVNRHGTTPSVDWLGTPEARGATLAPTTGRWSRRSPSPATALILLTAGPAPGEVSEPGRPVPVSYTN